MGMSLQERQDQVDETEEDTSVIKPEDTGQLLSEPWIPDRMDRAVIGPDDRITVNDTMCYPFCAIAYMDIRGSCGCNWSCTGYMVGRRGLVTAAHCLVCVTHHMPIKSCDFYFGYYNNRNYYYLYSGLFSFWYGTDFKKGYDDGMEWDYGYVLFDEAIGDYTGWFGLKALSDKDFSDSKYFYASGYRDGLLKYDYNRVSVAGPRLLHHYIDAVPGTSGGPLYEISGNDCYAVGIHIAEHSNEYNFARRITKDILDKMKNDGVIQSDSNLKTDETAAPVIINDITQDDIHDLKNFGYRFVSGLPAGSYLPMLSDAGTPLTEGGRVYFNGDNIFINLYYERNGWYLAYYEGVYGFVDKRFVI